MAELTERRSTRLRKPKTHFDDQISQSLRPSKPSKAPKAVEPPTEPSTKDRAAKTAILYYILQKGKA